jgi:hypothetical protein
MPNRGKVRSAAFVFCFAIPSYRTYPKPVFGYLHNISGGVCPDFTLFVFTLFHRTSTASSYLHIGKNGV